MGARAASIACAVLAPNIALSGAISIEEAWRAWVGDVGPSTSTLAITHNGELVATFGIGMAADDPVPLASLSKAVTGACILALIDEGKVQLATTMDEVFAARPEMIGTAGSITLEALLTQTAGLHVDSTQTLMNPTLWGGPDMHDQITALAFGRAGGASEFFYNNENYAALGSTIMEVTGQSVADACAPRVLADLTTAMPDRRSGGSLSWGGWAMSVADYATFAASLVVRDDWPRVSLGTSGATYGPGVFVRDTANGHNIWHFGGSCALGLADYGTYFFVLDNGWGVVVAYDVCITNDQALALNNALARAASIED